MIEGVKVTKLKIISDHRGSVLTMLRSDSEIFKSFGEIYFSKIKKNYIKNKIKYYLEEKNKKN